jgi:hypothetical protein
MESLFGTPEADGIVPAIRAAGTAEDRSRDDRYLAARIDGLRDTLENQ